ncbi:uncharacterized protein CIMG_04955 [Coccidioides immitis RS]|uniref:Uncharacterized protein n=4 Tax=Coccidioides immitis TaxID=5501 RepID=J3KEK7_COCIM|nr:uncharacterized protein CIMG_04955 [Coccidioides immitis RS]KMP05139.1 hypothetical protein CIRG_04820 [Coccidioides immitis RMSCC 2394]KMU77664.1 hypothetical protein CISG_01421 [Coccidioides immitis RMSCC 3703]KMU85591.1 hypothetical protein CIHG_03632 [Coccidioides immitis H538.4]TPX21540.1 hypothetical protein DIZ76_015499 [Coccidioides immitis]EAS33931.3 hypothetical protein CIMG_04955 [Coccidioides immitis RS]
MSSQISIQTRSIYRSILRELPQRPLSSPSPLQKRIRTYLANPEGQAPADLAQARIEEVEQFSQYLRAQRQYTTLLERYNPGADVDEQERVRLTARRVGMDLPVGSKDANAGNEGKS